MELKASWLQMFIKCRVTQKKHFPHQDIFITHKIKRIILLQPQNKTRHKLDHQISSPTACKNVAA